eukprot:gnl/TRDRNA2_/TRDRNA2_147141_c0_seq1.p2 gnl/TRDRNA2_/TRDRNA2_147141_c0~~gnl/TRDRNA2_/TRDRNA2_147141_c0_seq1.p2  ORF type:complete len:125 (+),score=6.13 gnl/TRDRNA2_/TRDRNA2_147141_c0_seq1:86-460(+)
MSTVPETEVPEPLPSDQIPPFIRSQGYDMHLETPWKAARGNQPAGPVSIWRCKPALDGFPELRLGVTGHKEASGHTWYTIECSIHRRSCTQSWQVSRRLAHLQVFHEKIKTARQHFGETLPKRG